MAEKLKSGASGKPVADSQSSANKESARLKGPYRPRSAPAQSIISKLGIDISINARARSLAARWGASLPQLEALAAKKEGSGLSPETVPSLPPIPKAEHTKPQGIKTPAKFMLPENWDKPPAPRKPRLQDPLFDALDEKISAKYGKIDDSYYLFSLDKLSKQDTSTSGSNQRVRLVCGLMEKFNGMGKSWYSNPSQHIIGPAGDTISFSQALSKLTEQTEHAPAFFLRMSNVHLVKVTEAVPYGMHEVSKMVWHVDYGGEGSTPMKLLDTHTEISCRSERRTGVRVKLWLPVRLAFAAAAIWAVVHFIGPCINSGASQGNQQSGYGQSYGDSR